MTKMRTTLAPGNTVLQSTIGIVGFVVCAAFWAMMVFGARLLEDSREMWWLCSLLALAFGVPALICALISGKRGLLCALGFAALTIVALTVLPWHPRKAFLDDLGSLKAGMGIAQVRSRMARYSQSDGVFETKTSSSIDPSFEGSVYYRWNTVDPRYNADLGKVEFQRGKVVRTEFLPD